MSTTHLSTCPGVVHVASNPRIDFVIRPSLFRQVAVSYNGPVPYFMASRKRNRDGHLLYPPTPSQWLYLCRERSQSWWFPREVGYPSQLSGSHGEWTMGDDFDAAAQTRNKHEAKTTRFNKNPGAKNIGDVSTFAPTPIDALRLDVAKSEEELPERLALLNRAAVVNKQLHVRQHVETIGRLAAEAAASNAHVEDLQTVASLQQTQHAIDESTKTRNAIVSDFQEAARLSVQNTRTDLAKIDRQLHTEVYRIQAETESSYLEDKLVAAERKLEFEDSVTGYASKLATQRELSDAALDTAVGRLIFNRSLNVSKCEQELYEAQDKHAHNRRRVAIELDHKHEINTIVRNKTLEHRELVRENEQTSTIMREYEEDTHRMVSASLSTQPVPVYNKGKSKSLDFVGTFFLLWFPIAVYLESPTGCVLSSVLYLLSRFLEPSDPNYEAVEPTILPRWATPLSWYAHQYQDIFDEGWVLSYPELTHRRMLDISTSGLREINNKHPGAAVTDYSWRNYKFSQTVYNRNMNEDRKLFTSLYAQQRAMRENVIARHTGCLSNDVTKR